MSWRDRAACRDLDTNIFFAEDAQPALAVCAGCTVREQCLEWALTEALPDGVFGGKTAQMRRVCSRKPLCPRCGRKPQKRKTGFCDECERELAAVDAWDRGEADPASDGRRRYRTRRGDSGAGERAGSSLALQGDPTGWRPGRGAADETGER